MYKVCTVLNCAALRALWWTVAWYNMYICVTWCACDAVARVWYLLSMVAYFTVHVIVMRTCRIIERSAEHSKSIL